MDKIQHVTTSKSPVAEKPLSIWKRIHWVNAVFLIACPLVVLVLVPFDYFYSGMSYGLIALLVGAWMATNLTITAGYHRLIAHRSYEAKPVLKLLYLIFGAAAFQGSALKWGSDHRRHHKYVDLETDPYAITKGFWYAHIGWLFLKEDPDHEKAFAADLKADPLVAWQHKYYIPLAIAVGFLLPTLVGWVFFDRLGGGLLYGGFVRILISHHSTFFINSLCHMWGRRPYSLMTSARDNFVLAVLTCGEGYHNYHHRFEADYRNGIRWYHWDPTKWFIQIAAYFKMAKNLRRISDVEILKAKLAVQENMLMQKGRYNERIQLLRARIEENYKHFLRIKKSYQDLKQDLRSQGQLKLDQGRVRLNQLQFEMAAAKIEFQAAIRQWNLVLQSDMAFA